MSVADRDKTWHILGAGAIGGLWAARLYQAGRPVKLILRPDSARRYQKLGGLRLITGGDNRLLPIPAINSAHLKSELRRVLVCTKAPQTLPALKSIQRGIRSDTRLVIVQNGLGIAEKIRARFPDCQLFLGTTTQGATREAAFSVTPAGDGDTVIGLPEGGASSLLHEVVGELSVPGFPVSVSDDIQPVLWRKLAINCAINPLTVVYRCRNGELLSNFEAREHLARVCSEIVTVSEAAGQGNAVHNLEQAVVDVAKATAANRSSMLQDVEAGRTTEIDYITGYLCREAGKIGVQVPENTALLTHVCSLSQ